MTKKKFLHNPVIFGVLIAIGAMLINLVITTLAEGSISGGIDVLLENGIFVLLVPLAIGIQMFLFRYHRNMVQLHHIDKSEKIGISGAVTSSGSMVFCCLHHISDLVPTLGFLLATTSFLSDFKYIFTIFGILINFSISVYILNLILNDNKISNVRA